MARPSVCGLLIVLLSCVVWSTHAQFPAVCASNATTDDGICCPTPDGFVDPCGGSGRGSCISIVDDQDGIRNLDPFVYGNFENDDRLHWPLRFFKQACTCEGNFFGYACHECVFGYRGVNCDVKYRAIRKDVTKLTPAEKEQFRRVVHISKKAPSDYVVLKSVFDQDPSTAPTFTSVSVYDLIAFMHVYTARHTVVRDDNGEPTLECTIDTDDASFMDFGHRGPAFQTWHRAFLLIWERALQKAADEPDFTFPYWDWTDKGHTCEVCNNDLVGATNSSNPDGPLDSGSPFGSWDIICQFPAQTYNCNFCEPDGPRVPLTRKLSGLPFPTKKQVEYALSLPTYDLPPYNSHTSKESFRNVLFGSAGAEGNFQETGYFTLHARGHEAFSGSMASVSLAANDPVFILHHTFVDKLFEVWIRKYEAGLHQLPKTGASPGHNRYDNLVPFFPVLKNSEFFVKSTLHGYDYEDMDVFDSVKPTESPEDDEDDDDYSEKTIWVLSIVVGALVIFVIILVACYICNRKPPGKIEAT